jgi:hypothetical protein
MARFFVFLFNYDFKFNFKHFFCLLFARLLWLVIPLYLFRLCISPLDCFVDT